MDKVIGSEIKIKLTVTDIDECNFADTEFNCKFWTNDKENKSVIQSKGEMTKVNEHSFVTVVDSNIMGEGLVKLELTMYVPDDVCTDGQRTEILRGTTDINIIL